MKHVIMTMFMAVILSSAGMYANDLPDDNESIVNTSKEIIRNMKKLRFGEIIKFCYPGSALENDMKKQVADYESENDESLVLEIKKSKFSYLNNVFDVGGDKGIIVCKTDEKEKKEFQMWIFRKHENTWYLYSWKDISERQL
ncbi:MAG: hypothetical protein KAZ87_09105 [Spirochaetes bacterium]|nr:hypothetical protein [Spirochaetota bacterium]